MTWEESDIRHALVILARALSSGHHELPEEDEQFVEDLIEIDEDALSPEQIRRLHEIYEAYDTWAEENDPDEEDPL